MIMDDFSALLSSLDENKTVYIRGISKHATTHEIINHFNVVGHLAESDIHYHPVNKGIIYISYKDEHSANKAIEQLHRSELLECIINVKKLIKINNKTVNNGSNNYINKDPIVQRKVRNKSNFYNADGHNDNKNIDIAYTTKSIMINHIEYPIPTGKYLMQLLQLSSLCIEENKQIISTLLRANNSSKEISESFAMFNGLQQIGKLKGINFNDIKLANVFVIGDGSIPFTSMILALLLPHSFKIFSIDPILDFDITSLGKNSNIDRIELHCKKSEDFVISESPGTDFMSIVIACHSHAPLEEFYNRISTMKKCAVSLPCCGKFWSIMKNIEPMAVYDDYEIFSPRRKVYLYSN